MIILAWTYSGNPKTSPGDEIRFLIGDTVPDDPLLQDEEIGYAYLEESNVIEAAISCALAIAAKFSRQADRDNGKLKVSLSQRAKAYHDLADKLRLKMGVLATPYAGGLTISEKQTLGQNTDATQSAFSRGQMNNKGTLAPVGNNTGEQWGGGFYNGF